jgi:hypothetical protein
LLKKSTTAICTIFALIISIFLISLLVTFTTFGRYQKSFIFYYDPDEPSSIEELKLNCDITDTEILYNSTPMEEVIKIEVNFYIYGPLVSGKTYLNYYKPILWDNTSSPVKFSMESLPTVSFEKPSIDNNVIVTLRTDILYDITTIASKGNIEITNYPNTHIGLINLTTNKGNITLLSEGAIFTRGLSVATTSGDISLKFVNSSMKGSIRINSTSGNIMIKSYNMECPRNCVWNFDTSRGNIDMEILQYKDLGGSVIGTADTSSGSINIVYEDNLHVVGARFGARAYLGGYSYSNSSGFKITYQWSQFILYDSLDYVKTVNRYNLLCTTHTGIITLYVRSVPFDY